MKTLLAVSVLICCLSSCASRQRDFNYALERDPRNSEFVIGAGDIVKVTVWKTPELSTEARVRPDGTITLPLVGDVRVLAKTPSEVKLDIAQRLTAYVKDEAATVTVAVTEVNSYRFTVSGNVERPGIYNAKQYMTVNEAIALAGGPNKFSSPSQTVILRQDVPGQIRKIPIDYADIRAGDHPEQNLVVLAGDNIYVP
jgi:polysaccharide biosynthesis/export protein